MDNSKLFEYFTRVNFNETDLDLICQNICDYYGLGSYKLSKLIEVGYEDVNIRLVTSTGSYVIKFFNIERDDKNIKRYAQILDILNEKRSLFNTPILYKNADNEGLSYYNESVPYVVFEFIDGKTIYDLKKNIDLKTLLTIVFDILKFNCALPELKEYIYSPEGNQSVKYDMWSYENFLEEYKLKSKYLTKEEEILIKPVKEYYLKMKNRYKRFNKDWEGKSVMPPYMTVHNDFISTNIIIKEEKGVKKPYYIDFSITNKGLNFVDIAIFGCDSCLNPNSNSEEYVKILKIISYILYRVKIMEYNLYPSSVAVQHAIHILIAGYYKRGEHLEAPENDYFLALGTRGLKLILEQNLLNRPVFNWYKDSSNWYHRLEVSPESDYVYIKNELKELGLYDYVEENINNYYKEYNLAAEQAKNPDYLPLDPNDLDHNSYEWLYYYLEQMNKDDVVTAISFCNENEWNNSLEEQEYINLNIEALNRGVKMQRVFVTGKEKIEALKENISIKKFINYKENNLEIMFIDKKEFIKKYKNIYNKIYPGIVVFNDIIAFKDAIEDIDNRGYIITNKEKIKKYHSYYNDIKNN